MEELYLTVINNLHDGVYFVDNDRQITFWNKAAEEITGYTEEEIIGTYCTDSKLHHIDEDGRPLCIVGCPLFATIIDGKQRKERVFVRHKEGYRIPVLVNILPVVRNGEIQGAVEIFTKDTPTVYDDNLVHHLEEIAMHDDLTHLPNRRYLESFMSHKLDEFNRFKKPFGIVYGDIDNFSDFNNKYGHETGDEILKALGKGILNTVRSCDLVGRWGGEEFIGIYSVDDKEEILRYAKQQCKLVGSTEIIHNDLTLFVTCSMGVTMVKEGDTLDTLLERADELMYKSKKAGKNQVTGE